MNLLRRLPTALLLLAALWGLSACGTKQERTTPAAVKRFTVILDFFPNADHAGLYAAIDKGTFRRAGLDVSPKVPSDPAAPLKLVAAGKADVAISYEPELLLARDKGLPLVAIGAIVQTPLTSIIAIKGSKVKRVADLEGAKVGTAGIPYQSAYLKTIAAGKGLDARRIKEIGVGFNLVPAMLSKRVDATLGGFSNYEGLQLQRQHKDPVIIPVDRAGVPTYNELVLVARAQDLRARSSTYRAFLQALARGYHLLRTDPEAGVRPLLAANRDLDRGLQLAAVKKTLPAFFPPRGRPFGYMDPPQWQAYGRWMVHNGLLKRPPAGRSLTNEFLPGQGF